MEGSDALTNNDWLRDLWRKVAELPDRNLCMPEEGKKKGPKKRSNPTGME